MPTSDVAIVGAGPYGLSTAAHLRAANGLDIQIFGKPMSFWEQHMPKGMLLRSPLAGSHLSDPQRSLTLHDYEQVTGSALAAPLPLPRFIHYGQWFQSRAVPSTHPQKIERIEKNGGGFYLTTDRGEKWKARRVVVAAGIESFAWRPEEFRSLPAELASHTCDHQNLSCFAGKRVVVIGAGQSALESAALLREVGAEIELLVRAASVRWLWRQKWFHTFRPVAMLLYAPPDVGQAGLSHIVARPNLFRRLPRSVQDRWGVRAIRPAAAAWLHQRCTSIPIRTGVKVKQATVVSGQARLKLSDGTERLVDHVLLATGYRVNIGRYPFLSPKVLESIQRVNGYPCLDASFESSVEGLHFVGAPAAWSFGPLMRFVAGADLASKAVTRGILRKD
jgi:cation diffusion facilitator CzcD-associated flavoprotein CzcO